MMFTPGDMRSRLREMPFRPVRVVTTTGDGYDVFHPDLVLVGRRFLIVGTPASDLPNIADSVTRIELVHVAELRDLAPPPASSSNGVP